MTPTEQQVTLSQKDLRTVTSDWALKRIPDHFTNLKGRELNFTNENIPGQQAETKYVTDLTEKLRALALKPIDLSDNSMETLAKGIAIGATKTDQALPSERDLQLSLYTSYLALRIKRDIEHPKTALKIRRNSKNRVPDKYQYVFDAAENISGVYLKDKKLDNNNLKNTISANAREVADHFSEQQKENTTAKFEGIRSQANEILSETHSPRAISAFLNRLNLVEKTTKLGDEALLRGQFDLATKIINVDIPREKLNAQLAAILGDRQPNNSFTHVESLDQFFENASLVLHNPSVQLAIDLNNEVRTLHTVENLTRVIARELRYGDKEQELVDLVLKSEKLQALNASGLFTPEAINAFLELELNETAESINEAIATLDREVKKRQQREAFELKLQKVQSDDWAGDQNQISAQGETIAQLSQDKAALEGDKSQLMAQLREEHEAIDDLLVKLNTRDSQIDDLDGQVSELTAALEEIQSGLEESLNLAKPNPTQPVEGMVYPDQIYAAQPQADGLNDTEQEDPTGDDEEIALSDEATVSDESGVSEDDSEEIEIGEEDHMTEIPSFLQHSDQPDEQLEHVEPDEADILLDQGTQAVVASDLPAKTTIYDLAATRESLGQLSTGEEAAQDEELEHVVADPNDGETSDEEDYPF